MKIEDDNSAIKVRKTPSFKVKPGVFGGDKRDRTADLLNAMSAIREQNELSVFYSLSSLKSKNNYPLCVSWYTVFRRDSRFIQDKSVSRNRGVSPL